MFDSKYTTQRNISRGDILNKKKREEAKKKKIEEARKKNKKKKKDDGTAEVGRAKIANDLKTTTNTASSSQLPTQSHITQPSARPSQAEQSSIPQAVAFASPNVSADAIPPATTSLTPPPNPIILRPACCIPFLFFCGCASPYPHDHTND